MIKVIFLAITTLWMQVPTQDWDMSEKVYLPRTEKAFLVDSPQECAINLYQMNEKAKENDAKFTAVLLRIDLETGKQDTVQIPTLSFQEK